MCLPIWNYEIMFLYWQNHDVEFCVMHASYQFCVFLFLVLMQCGAERVTQQKGRMWAPSFREELSHAFCFRESC